MELNPLNMIEPVVIAGVVAIFILTHFVLRRVFFLPVIEVMERRRERLDTASTMRDQAAEVQRSAARDVDTLRERARSRAESVGQTVRERAQAARRERLDAARAESAKIVEDGRGAIATEREAELAKLRAETSSCVGVACERLLGRTDTHTIDAIVDRLVSRRIH